MRHLTRTASSSLPALLLALLLVQAPVGAQSAGDVLEEALQRHQERVEDIDDYTVVQTVMGTRVTRYLEKQMVDGKPVFRSPSSSDAEEEDLLANPYSVFPELAERAELKGREELDGHPVWLLEVSDFQGLDLAPSGMADGEFTPTAGTLYLDASEYVPRRVHLEGELTRGGRSSEVTVDVHLQDYRRVEGLLHPFRMRFRVEGIAGTLTPRQRERLEKLRKRLEGMSEEERKAMERMMGPQLQQMQKMLEGGSMEGSVEVVEVRVNQGPPSGEDGPGS